ncbi:class I SAM-dependent methyltransferase [Chloroflexota bacterium]
MNKTILKIARNVLLSSIIRKGIDRVCKYYALSRIERGLDAFEGESEFSTIMHSECLAAKKGGFNEDDSEALKEVVQMVLKDNMMVAEIGSWTGMSTAVLAKMVVAYQGKVFAVDHWLGSERVPDHEIATKTDIFSIFRRNMALLGVWDVVNPLVMNSETASQIFADSILDLVFIDADHRYEYVKKDILYWLPKLRNGGILCGHDCEGYYSEYSEEDRKTVDENLETDCIPTVEDYTPCTDDYTHNICHPGVLKALDDYFHGKYKMIPNSTIWYYIKT